MGEGGIWRDGSNKPRAKKEVIIMTSWKNEEWKWEWVILAFKQANNTEGLD